MRSRNMLESPEELLDSRGVIQENLDSDKPLTGTGPLRGIFGNNMMLVAISVTLLFAAAALFAIAYIDSNGDVAPFSKPGGDRLTMAAWIFGWITLIAGAVYLVLVFWIRAERAEDKRQALFKVEARGLEIDSAVPRQVEVIKVRCRYCGTLNEVGASNCSACGANL